jgi:hypothetical protein
MKNIATLSGPTVPQVIGLALCIAFAVAAHAQQVPNTATSQNETNQQLLDRINQLEAKVAQMEHKEAAATVPAAEPAPSVETPPAHVVADRLRFNVFGDVGYLATDRKATTNTFEIGSLDLFMTSRLSENVSALAEILFIPARDNSISPDVERLLLQYRHNDYFKFGIGRYHTTIGYYNTVFHQGAWFETAIGRPFMYEFDDKGGFLPLQEVGVTTSGRIPSGKLGLEYVAEVGNGRSHSSMESAQNRQDQDNGKSFNVSLVAHPNWISGLQTGFSFYHDNLTFADGINHGETTTTVHVMYLNSRYEFLNEGMLVRHTDVTGTRRVFHTPGFYTQVSRRFGGYRPYFRYSYVNPPADDPIYTDPTDTTHVTRQNGLSAGVRYDFTEHTAAKLQYDRLSIRNQHSSNGLATQFAFTF